MILCFIFVAFKHNCVFYLKLCSGNLSLIDTTILLVSWCWSSTRRQCFINNYKQEIKRIQIPSLPVSTYTYTWIYLIQMPTLEIVILTYNAYIDKPVGKASSGWNILSLAAASAFSVVFMRARHWGIAASGCICDGCGGCMHWPWCYCLTHHAHCFIEDFWRRGPTNMMKFALRSDAL